ncbi:hypothetical protein AB7M56_002441 [Bradyrhizobium elkanii]|nr:hypothetical protein [Bradyrhizobium elkanii]
MHRNSTERTIGTPHTPSANPWNIRLGLAPLVFAHTASCCVSLIFVASLYAHFHILFRESNIAQAAICVAGLSLISILFTTASFSFGYFVSFYLYTMIVGYVWLSYFSEFNYNTSLARLSAIASLLSAILPALLMRKPLSQIYAIPKRIFRHLPTAIIVLTASTVILGASYGFRVVGLAEMYKFQREIAYPGWMNYLIGITSTALIPFAFACCWTRSHRGQALLCLALSLLFYPITLNKLALFTPAWLGFVAILLKFFEERTVVVLSLLVPTLAGLVLFVAIGNAAIPIFGLVNFRMVAIPSSAMDVYNDFFSRHPHTFFCHVSILKFLDCPYKDQLGVVLAKEYQLGNFNASFLATEGVAAVGPRLAPVSSFLCGVAIGLANRMSAGLRPSFILISSAILPQVFLNVPFSTILFTHGAAILFLLWYITPRDDEEASREPGRRANFEATG